MVTMISGNNNGSNNSRRDDPKFPQLILLSLHYPPQRDAVTTQQGADDGVWRSHKKLIVVSFFSLPPNYLTPSLPPLLGVAIIAV